MSELVKLTINDKEYEAEKGSLLIDALLKELNQYQNNS